MDSTRMESNFGRWEDFSFKENGQETLASAKGIGIMPPRMGLAQIELFEWRVGIFLPN